MTWKGSICSGISSIFESFTKICSEHPGVIFDNIIEGIVSAIPVVGPEVLTVGNKFNAHYSEEILRDKKVKGGKEIAGIAIDGVVIHTIEVGKIDLMREAQIVEMTHLSRLEILSDFVQRNLFLMSEGKKNVDLAPVDKAIKAIFDAFESKIATKRDLAKIIILLKRILENLNNMDDSSFEKMQTIISDSIKIAEEWLEKNKIRVQSSTSAPPKDSNTISHKVANIMQLIDKIQKSESTIDSETLLKLQQAAETALTIANLKTR